MAELSPKIASELALLIYRVQSEKTATAILSRPEFTDNQHQKSILKAELGSRLKYINQSGKLSKWLPRTDDMFGLIAMGGAGTLYENDMFLIFRGTNPEKQADIITDARIGLQPSKTGAPVHIGFNQAFKSMLPKIRDLVNEYGSQVHMFHCIGHSLGGAVATLAADWLKTTTGKTVKTYTFGAPKVGLMLFAGNYTRKLKRENIYRVFHATDPVPMVPLFPFIHAPLMGYGHFVPSSEAIHSAGAHDMEKYWHSVKNREWRSFDRIRAPYTIDAIVEQFLRSKVPVNENTPMIWEWLSSAIIYVLRKVAGAAVMTLQNTVMVGLTAIDFTVYLLHKCIELYDSAKQWVLLLIQKINQVLRRKVPNTVEDLTREGMRRTIINLIHKANEEARKAIMRID